jgi:hypothetical protein
MRCYLVLLCSPLLAAALLWSLFAACVDQPLASGPTLARLVAAWDPLACGPPHRIVVELEDEAGARRSASVPCNLGGLTVDVAHFGVYRARIYAWALDAPARSAMAIELAIDEPIVHWFVARPP